MHLDEQKQFRVGKLEILGLAPSLEARLRSIIKPGELFDPRIVYDFDKENALVMVSDPLFNPLQVDRDVKAGIVNLLFDFRPCP
jgi:hypothetical protein